MIKKQTEFPPIIKNQIAKKILLGLVIGAAVPIFLSSPYGLYFLARGAVKMYFKKNDFRHEARRLQKRGYVALTKTSKGFLVKLLKKGERKQATLRMKNLQLSKSKIWDEQWRLLIFDIPEGNKLLRDLLSKKLKSLGMYNFQRSTFVYPYNCRKELDFLCGHYGLERYTTYAEVSYIDIAPQLKKYFKLK